MGNNATKESRNSSGHSRENSNQSPNSPTSPSFQFSPQSGEDRLDRGPYGTRISSRSRHDLSFLGIGSSSSNSDAANAAVEPRKETKQERAARHAERERVQRAKERERSLREEGVDGGYLVTLGTYVGPEDFSKSTVRQLQIERRLAPFWRGLNDHSTSWTEHQLVAAARGKPIPAPDEIPSQEEAPTSPDSQTKETTTAESSKISPVTVTSPQAIAGSLPPSSGLSIPGTSVEHSSSAPGSQPAPSPLFRGRAKTLASLTSSKSNATGDLTPQELHLPKDPNINGQPVEAYLYKDVLDCPICFLSYPPWLNKTRCCDQPICSECFVQIKRPDPHPPDHGEEGENPPSPRSYEEESQLVSEPAACPFCVQPEFGVMYDPPPFRRGLAYANQGFEPSTPSSTHSHGRTPSQRRRTESVSANAPTVITTDKVRPDWAKKLSDARAHQARRSAAATALHTAAYRMGSGPGPGFPILGRRRRVLVNAETGQRLEGINVENLIATLEGQGSSRGQNRGNNDLFPGRGSSRGSRTEDLEELMMMEAIRQSLAAEEERKKKSEKEAKKEEKKKAKEQKKADKAAKKSGTYTASNNSSEFFGPSASASQVAQGSSNEEGKGKARAPTIDTTLQAKSSLGWNPMEEPSSTLHTTTSGTQFSSQKPLEESKATLESEVKSNSLSSERANSPRQHLSSSSSESFDSGSGSALQESGAKGSFDTSPNSSKQQLPFVGGSHEPATSGSESGINFRSLAEMIGKDDKETGAVRVPPEQIRSLESNEVRGRGGSGESNRSQPPKYEEQADSKKQDDADAITAAPERIESNQYDQKHYGDVSMLEQPAQRQQSH